MLQRKKNIELKKHCFGESVKQNNCWLYKNLNFAFFFFNFLYHIGPAWVGLKKKYKKKFLKGEKNVFEGEKRVFFSFMFVEGIQGKQKKQVFVRLSICG